MQKCTLSKKKKPFVGDLRGFDKIITKISIVYVKSQKNGHILKGTLHFNINLGSKVSFDRP